MQSCGSWDQGPATNLFDGNSTFNSPKELDKAINNYIEDKQEKRTKNNSKFPAYAQIFEIINKEQ